MSGIAFRGTGAGQDPRFKDKTKKLLKNIKSSAPKEYEKKVDMKKVKKSVIDEWISKKVTEILGLEDEVVTGLVCNTLDQRFPDPKELQLNLTGFLEDKSPSFVLELWKLLLSAQANPTGIPDEMLENKKNELMSRTSENEEVASKISNRIVSQGQGRIQNSNLVGGHVNKALGGANRGYRRHRRDSSEDTDADDVETDEFGRAMTKRGSSKRNGNDRDRSGYSHRRHRDSRRRRSPSRSRSRSRSHSRSPRRRRRSRHHRHRSRSPSRSPHSSKHRCRRHSSDDESEEDDRSRKHRRHRRRRRDSEQSDDEPSKKKDRKEKKRDERTEALEQGNGSSSHREKRKQDRPEERSDEHQEAKPKSDNSEEKLKDTNREDRRKSDGSEEKARENTEQEQSTSPDEETPKEKSPARGGRRSSSPGSNSDRKSTSASDEESSRGSD